MRADEALGVIERVSDQTPWVSPLVVVPKRSPGRVRVCVDMRRANVAIKQELHVTPTINEVIHDLNPQMPKVKIHLRTPKGGGYHPPGFLPSRPNF